jgi:hypothetical protein
VMRHLERKRRERIRVAIVRAQRVVRMRKKRDCRLTPMRNQVETAKFVRRIWDKQEVRFEMGRQTERDVHRAEPRIGWATGSVPWGRF